MVVNSLLKDVRSAVELAYYHVKKNINPLGLNYEKS